jgi:SAM-dependent methyltransferase
MTSESRWSVAQAYEKSYWEGIAKNIAANAAEQLTWYDWKAKELDKKLDQIGYGGRSSDCRVLEVGSGPIGIVTYLSWGKRVALDPLSDFYGGNPELVSLRNSEVTYLTGSGENIPFADGHFDIVVIDNVLDHVRAAGQVLDEIHRVLKNDGHLYLELNIHTSWGCLLHSMLAALQIDKGHPYSFTREKIRSFLKTHGMTIIRDWQNDYYEAREADRKSDRLKAKVKGFTGLSEFLYFTLCHKTAGTVEKR